MICYPTDSDRILYRRTPVSARQSPDFDTPTQVLVIEERTCYTVWVIGHAEGLQLHATYFAQANARENAIDHAVALSAEIESKHHAENYGGTD